MQCDSQGVDSCEKLLHWVNTHVGVLLNIYLFCSCVCLQKYKRAYVERPSHATQREGIFGVSDGDYEEYYFIRLENC